MADTIEIEIDRGRLNDVPYTIYVERGTIVRFANISSLTALHVRGFSSSYWTSTSTAVVENGSPKTYYVKSNAPISTDQLEVYDPSNKSTRSFTIQVVSSIDKPNPYWMSPSTIDTSYSGLNANEFVVSQTYRLATEDRTVVHLRSDNPEVRFRLIDGSFEGNWVTDLFMNSVYRRDFQIAYRAPTEALTTKTVTVRIGSRTYTVSLSTDRELVPASHHVISLGHTPGSISLLDIKNFFGGDGNLRDYFRKGRNVPDMAANSGIPTSGDLRITDFRGAATAFFIAVHPSDKPFRQLSTSYGTRSVGVGWNIWSGEVDDWDLGYSKFIKDNAEFRYTLSYQFGSGYGTTNPAVKPKLSSNTGSPGTWSSSNKSVSVTVTAQKREEFRVICTVTMYARHKNYPDKTLSTSASVTVRAVGT